MNASGLPFFWVFVAVAALGAHEEPSYLNANAWESQKIISGIIAADPSHLKTDAERIEWARARLAAIALARLQGKEEEAIRLFGGCGLVCERYGDAAEWKGVKGWATAKKKRH